MGIRFRCHQCGHELHVKDFQGGKRSRCPECETKFRIPAASAEYSIPLDSSSSANAARSNSVAVSAASTTSSVAATRTTSGSAVTEEPTGLDLSSNVTSRSGAREAVDPSDVPSRVKESESPAVAKASASQPRAITEAPGASWYVRPPAGGQYGPAPSEIFCEWLFENRVTRDSLVWRDGWPQWLVAENVFDDYFGPAVAVQPSPFASSAPVSSSIASVEQPVASGLASASSSVADATVGTSTTDFIAPTTMSDRVLAARKRQRKKNYMILIGVLATISVGLVIALVVVLMNNM